MASGISIGIASDTRQFQAGVSDATDQLQKMGDTLDNLNGEGSSAKLIDSLKHEQTAAQETAGAYRQLGSAQQESAEQGSTAFEVSTREQKSLTREATTEINKGTKDMAANFAQGAAGMAGSLGNVTDTAESLLQTMSFLGGPEIAIPAAAAAVVIGLIQSAFNNSQESAQALQQAVADLTGQFDTLGVSGADGVTQVNKTLDKMNQDGTLGKIAEGATAAKIPFKSLADAIASNNIPAMQRYKAAIDAAVISETKQAAGLYNANGAQTSAYNADVKRINALTTLQGTLNDNITTTKLAADAHSNYAQAVEKTAAANAAATAEQKAWSAQVHESYTSAAEDSKDWATDNAVDLAQVAQNLQEANAMAARLPSDITKDLASGLSQAGLKFVESLPNGEQILDQLALNPGSAANAKLIAAANTSGVNAGKAASDGITKTPTPTIKAKVDITESLNAAQAQFDAFYRKNNNKSLNVNITTSTRVP